MKAANGEIEDIQTEWVREKEDMLNNIRELTVQLKLKSLIIDNFIPPDEQKSVEGRSEWDSETESWKISHKKLAGLTLGGNAGAGNGNGNAGGNANASPSGGRRPNSATGNKRPISEYARVASSVGENARFRV